MSTLCAIFRSIIALNLLVQIYCGDPNAPKTTTCAELHAYHRRNNPDAPSVRPNVHPYIPPPPLLPLIASHEKYVSTHSISSSPLGTGKFTYGVFPLVPKTTSSKSSQPPPKPHVVKILKPTSMKRVYREIHMTSLLPSLPYSPTLLACAFLNVTNGEPVIPKPEQLNTTELDGQIITVIHMTEGVLEGGGWRGGRLNRCRMRLFKLISSVNDLHALGIVHLDVKPSNFHGSTLLDYGLSTYSGLETSTKVATLNYKSPELCDDFWSDGGGEAVDVWAVGCVVYEVVREWLKGRGLLAEGKRRRLFNGRNKVEVRKQQAKFCRRLRRGKGAEWGIARGKKLRKRERRFLDEIEEMLEGMMKEEGGERWTLEECLNSRMFNRYRRMKSKKMHDDN
ncbi:hypothetical protein TrVE_jg4318 [Triparma verrucosa]|uniref:Protein kinase domain-containing protein n=1 Tax=Triparma verrucosa TaxID=1606542 RepID=A0A9W7C0D4_9STRA|nr:hypothetical protein TrVE_jg4318 [Triparma verrucosa]